MRVYVTHFDRTYLAKGIVLHESLLKYSSERFVLFVLAMDRETFEILRELQLRNAIVYPIDRYGEMQNLASVKAGRTYREYCWTLASEFLNFIMTLAGPEFCTYVDADVCFFCDPIMIFGEIRHRSIGITPHRLNERDRERLGGNGTFNVGIVVARQNNIGRACISRWAQQCRERCSETVGCGDQLYLDSWPSDYGAECCIIENLGVNLGPWSIGNFAITQRNGRVSVNDDILVCYHFHEFRNETFLTGWPLRPEDVELIYKPYIAEWQKANEIIREVEAKIALEAEWERA